MIRSIAFAAALALAAPAAAQDAPQPPAPFQVASLQPQMSGAISLPTRSRDGDVAKATLVFVLSPEMSAQMSGIGRMDMDYEFRCGEKVSRTVGVTAWNPQGELIGRLPDQASEWEAVNPVSPNEDTRAYLCDGAALDGPVVDSIAAFQALHSAQ